MKFIDLTIPLGIGTPPWPTYEPLQVKYFKRLAPNGANGQVVTHSNHVGTHLDGEIHFYTPGKDMASLDFEFLTGDAAIVDLSDCCGDFDIYTPHMIEERVEVREGDILIIHTGYHHFGWDQPYGNEVRYMVMHPGPDARFVCYTQIKYSKERCTLRAVSPVCIITAFIPCCHCFPELVIFLVVVRAVIFFRSQIFSKHFYFRRRYSLVWYCSFGQIFCVIIYCFPSNIRPPWSRAHMTGTNMISIHPRYY